VIEINKITLSRSSRVALIISLLISLLTFVPIIAPTPANAVDACLPDVSESSGYVILKFTQVGTCSIATPTGTTSMQGLIIGGGGGGGGAMGGGGGGGGYIEFNALAVSNQTLNITVGEGGAGAPAGTNIPPGTSGGNSLISGTGILLTALGGAGGASRTFDDGAPARIGGGSGGGGAGGVYSGGDLSSAESQTSQSQSPTLSSIDGNQFGNNGSPKFPNSWLPGGGGGAGSPGERNPGHGGNGRANSILGTSYFWAGGGGGSGWDGVVGNGGDGGGGAGGGNGQASSHGGAGLNPGTVSPKLNKGGAGGANTGGGGGGGTYSDNPGGNGGSGIVVLKYLAPSAGSATKLKLSRVSVGTERGVAFTTQPQIGFRDSAYNSVTDASAVITASISDGGTLLGTTTATTSAGVATFTNLGVDGVPGTTYTITYSAPGLTSITQSILLSGTTCTGQSFACLVGDTGPGGGIVFYIAPSTFTQVGATGDMCATNCTYLEAAPSGWISTSDPKMVWNNGISEIGASVQRTAIGFGYANSIALVAAGFTDTATSAAQLARTYTGGGKTDWYLPALNELNQMCKWVRGQAWTSDATACDSSGDINSGVGAVGFGGDVDRYWSSTEGSDVTAWWQDFSDGTQRTWDYKGTNITRVRPIRAFYSNYAPTRVQITRASAGTQRGAAFTTQPQITIKTLSGSTAVTSSAVVTASISAGGSLVGTTTATAVAGVATFSNLGVDGTVGSTYTVTYSSGAITVDTATVTLTGSVCNGRNFTCRPGDLGPGGGTIYYYSSSGFDCGPSQTDTCNYLEVAPKTWNGGSSDPLVAMLATRNDSLDIPGVAQESTFNRSNAGRGLGYKNSLAFTNFVNSSASVGAGLVATYRGGSKSDWYVPSSTEMNLLCQWAFGLTQNPTSACSGSTLLNGGFTAWPYWTSSQWTDGSGHFAGYIQYFDSGSTNTDQWGDGNIALRPIRAFAPPAGESISVAAIGGVTVPVTGATPVTSVTGANGYTGSVTWSGSPSRFAASTTYTATITLTATSGYTLNGITANFFTVADATSVSHSANSGVITVVFPATAAASSAREISDSDRQIRVNSARIDLLNKIKSKSQISAADYYSAEISLPPVTSLARINSEVQKLQAKSPDLLLDLTSVQAVIQKVTVVELLSNAKTKNKVSASELIQAGFLDAKSQSKTTVILGLRRILPTSLDTVEKVQGAIAAQLAKVQQRKDHLQNVLANRPK